LAGDLDELEAILGRKEGPRDRNRVENGRKQDHRQHHPASGHADPP
jgi:hypothetical protein